MYQHPVTGGHHGKSQFPAVEFKRIFSWIGRSGNQITGIGICRHVIEEENGILFQDRISLVFQEFLILGVAVVAPQMGSDPTASDREQPPIDSASRSCISPYIRNGVSYPARTSVHSSGCFFTVFR